MVIMRDLWKVLISMTFDGCEAYAVCMNEAMQHWRELGLDMSADKLDSPQLLLPPIDKENRLVRLALLEQAHDAVCPGTAGLFHCDASYAKLGGSEAELDGARRKPADDGLWNGAQECGSTATEYSAQALAFEDASAASASASLTAKCHTSTPATHTTDHAGNTSPRTYSQPLRTCSSSADPDAELALANSLKAPGTSNPRKRKASSSATVLASARCRREPQMKLDGWVLMSSGAASKQLSTTSRQLPDSNVRRRQRPVVNILESGWVYETLLT